jgi:hypothetical protein
MREAHPLRYAERTGTEFQQPAEDHRERVHRRDADLDLVRCAAALERNVAFTVDDHQATVGAEYAAVAFDPLQRRQHRAAAHDAECKRVEDRRSCGLPDPQAEQRIAGRRGCQPPEFLQPRHGAASIGSRRQVGIDACTARKLAEIEAIVRQHLLHGYERHGERCRSVRHVMRHILRLAGSLVQPVIR